MLTIECAFEGEAGKLEVYEDKLVLLCKVSKIFEFAAIKSVHVKNDNGFLLKIKLEESSAVLSFSSLHLRDMTKNIIFDRIKNNENIQKAIINSNVEYSKTYKNVKSLINEEKFVKYLNGHQSLHFQSSSEKITPESFFKVINQPLLDVFINMNCSVEQFYNLLVSSYFYDIKNTKNSLDRLLAERLRNFGSSIDYASRINSYSLLNMAESKEIRIEDKQQKNKKVEFDPICPFEEHHNPYNNTYDFNFKPLEIDIPLKNENETVEIFFDQSDFEVARDLCKIMYKNQNQEGLQFSETFTNILVGKYGKHMLKYASRLIPSFYYRSQSE